MEAPFYTLQLTNVENVEIHSISIVSRRTEQTTHDFWDLSAFNTDGIDVAGNQVWSMQQDFKSLKEKAMTNLPRFT